MPFAVGNRVRCIDAVDNRGGERLREGQVYEVTFVSARGTGIKVDGKHAVFRANRFVLVNEAVRVPIPNPQPQAPARRTSVKYVVVDEDSDWHVYDDQDDAEEFADELREDGVEVLALKKVTLTLND